MATLQIAFDPSGLDPKVVHVLDDIVASIQTWAGKLDGIGRWVDVPYNAGIYNSVAGTWTVQPGNHKRFRYALIGDETMALQICLVSTTTGAGMGNDLRVTIPDGFQLKPNATGAQDSFNFAGTCEYNQGATSGVGLVYAGEQDKAPTQLRLLRDVLPSSTNWPSSVTDLTIAFNVIIPVVRT